MQDQELIQKVAQRLIGMQFDDLTTAERQIVNILIDANVVAIRDDEVVALPTQGKPGLFLVNNDTLVKATSPASALLITYYHEEPDAHDNITEWLEEHDLDLDDEAAFAENLLAECTMSQGVVEVSRAQAEAFIKDRLDGTSPVAVIL